MKARTWLCSARIRAVFGVAGMVLVAAGAALAGPVRPSGTDCAGSEPTIVEVMLSGQSKGPHKVWRSQDALCLRRDTLESWRFEGARNTTDDYLALSDLAHLSYWMRAGHQQLVIEAGPKAFHKTLLQGSMRAATPQPSDVGGFVDYQANGLSGDGATVINGSATVGLFSSWGTLTSTHVFSDLTRQGTAARIETRWDRELPRHTSRLRLGDSITDTGEFGVPLRFAGIQVATDFSIRPDFVSYPLPTLEGEAALPSVVEVYTDGALRFRHDVEAGTFSIRDAPALTGSGEVELVVRDLLGNEVRLAQPFFVNTQLLAKGVSDYSYHLGTMRTGFGRDDSAYSGITVGGSHRRGLTQKTTLETAAHYADDDALAGAGVLHNLNRFGLVGASYSASDSLLGQGGMAAFSWQRSVGRLSLGLRSRWADREFLSPGDSAERRVKRSSQFRLGFNNARFGTLSLTMIDEERFVTGSQELMSATYSRRLGEELFFAVSASKTKSTLEDESLRFSVSMPLGRERASLTHRQSNRRSSEVEARLRRSAPVGPGWGYSLLASSGDSDRVEVGANVQRKHYDLRLRAEHIGHKTNYLGQLRGSVAFLGGGIHATRPLTQSFGLVRVEDVKGARVFHENQFVGTTGRHGNLLIPYLRPFQENRLRIDAASIPISTRIDHLETTAVPFSRSGLVIDFPVDNSASLLVEVWSQGKPVLRGSRLELSNGREAVVGSHGRAFLEGLELDEAIEFSISQLGLECRGEFRPTREIIESEQEPRLLCK